jgi:alkanesulfonate monooxygenase SsuD/methylene tetrahydromethanopterin reductase-like flavin-dependent oxidoreductase (luciferase family)
LRETSRSYRNHRDDAGFDAASEALSINRFVYVSDDDARARREIEGPFMTFIAQHAPDLKAALHEKYNGAFHYERFVSDFCIFGSPATVASRMRQLQTELGTSYLLCSLNLITLDHQLCLRSMELMATEVMPQIREPAEATR